MNDYVFFFEPAKPTIHPINNPFFKENTMKVAILGTGAVGIDLAKGFVAQGHSVVFGTRDAAGAPAQKAVTAIAGSQAMPYADAAKTGDLAVLVTPWSATQSTIGLVGAANLAGKLVIDVTNPLDFSTG